MLELPVLEEPQARPEEHRHEVEVKLVCETSPQELPADVDAADHLNRLAPAASVACATTASRPPVTNVNVSCWSCFGATCGGSWVSTKMGTQNS